MARYYSRRAESCEIDQIAIVQLINATSPFCALLLDENATDLRESRSQVGPRRGLCCRKAGAKEKIHLEIFASEHSVGPVQRFARRVMTQLGRVWIRS